MIAFTIDKRIILFEISVSGKLEKLFLKKFIDFLKADNSKLNISSVYVVHLGFTILM